VDEEPTQSAPSKECQTNKSSRRNLLHSRLALFADRDAPSNAEHPDSVAEVVSRREGPEHIQNKEQAVIGKQLIGPGSIFDMLGRTRDVLGDARADHVVQQEGEKENSRDPLIGVVAVLTELVGFFAQIRHAPVRDEESIDRVEKQW